MAPINLPDGTEVSEIVLPDGSTASEVIAPDGSAVFSAIPDSAELHIYDFSASDTTTGSVTDTAGSADLDDGSFSGFTTIEGVQAGDFNDDAIEVDFTDIAQPVEVFIVFSLNDGSRDQRILGGGPAQFVPNSTRKGQYRIEAGTNVFGGNPDTNNHISRTRFDGSASFMELEESQVLSGDAGTNNMPGITAGAVFDERSTERLSGAIGEIRVYDPSVSGYDAGVVYSDLNSKWSVF